MVSPEKKARIERAWETIEAADPDISTERLIAMTCDLAGVTWSEVVDAVFTEVKR